MKEDKRSTIVGIFMIVGMVIVGWMVFQFGDLPAFVSRYDACEVAIFFPEAPGGDGDHFVRLAIENNVLIIPGNVFS